MQRIKKEGKNIQLKKREKQKRRQQGGNDKKRTQKLHVTYTEHAHLLVPSDSEYGLFIISLPPVCRPLCLNSHSIIWLINTISVPQCKHWLFKWDSQITPRESKQLAAKCGTCKTNYNTPCVCTHLWMTTQCVCGHKCVHVCV